MSDHPDDTDRRLARLLASRDPREAPAALRERIAAVPHATGTRPARWARIILPFRPAVAVVGTAAAVLIGFLALAALRGSPSPGIVGPGSTPLGPAGQAPDYHTAGLVLTLPIWLPVGALLIGLLGVWLALEPVPGGRVPAIVHRPPRGFGWIARPVRRRLALLAAAGIVLAGGNAASGIDALVRGSSFAPMPAHYMGSTHDPASDREAAFFRYAAGSTIAFIQTIRNQGAVPVTILGLGGDLAQQWMELRIYPVQDENIVGEKPGSVPFLPIELAPDGERQILFVVHLARDCPGSAPVPSPEPTPDAADFTEPTSGGWTSFDTIELRYSVLGLERTGTIELDPVPTIWSDGNVACSFDYEWANPSPSASSAAP